MLIIVSVVKVSASQSKYFNFNLIQTQHNTNNLKSILASIQDTNKDSNTATYQNKENINTKSLKAPNKNNINPKKTIDIKPETQDTTPVNTTPVNTTPTLTLGEIKDNVYNNEYLGVTMNIPERWHTLSEEERMAVMQAGIKMLNEDKKYNQATIDLALQKTLLLIMATEKDPLKSDKYSANIQLSAEKMDSLFKSLIKTPKDYLNAMRTHLESIKEVQGIEIKYNFGEVENIVINGKDFFVLPTNITLSDGTIITTQDISVCFDKDYVFVVSYLYFNNEQKEILKTSLKTIKFY